MKQIFFVVILFALTLSISCEKHVKQHNLTKLMVTNPIRKDTIIFKEYVCQIRSIQHIELRALEKGYLQNIYVDEGRFIKQGQLMFRIMPLIYQAEVQKAEAEVKFAEVEYTNTQRLAEKNIVSQSELSLSKAKLDKAKAELVLAQTHQGFTEIKAPFSGIMGRFQVRLGSLVDEGDLLTTLSDNSKVWVYFNVSEVEYLNLALSNHSEKQPKVRLQMANGQLFEDVGTVETIEADFNNETGNIAFRATFSNNKGILRHGETGNILMPVPLKDVLLVPQKATFEILGKRYVFVVEDQVATTRQVSTGAEMAHLFVITKGLNETDKIIVEGLRKVKNGEKVDTELVKMEKVIAEMNSLHAE